MTQIIVAITGTVVLDAQVFNYAEWSDSISELASASELSAFFAVDKTVKSLPLIVDKGMIFDNQSE